MIDEKYKVCVLLATYNGEKYLKEMINSLIQQEKVKVQILVRDDNSSDETTNILNEYKEKKLLDWYSGPHLGVEKNFLDLISHAPDCDFYALCDQDDVWDKNKLFVARDKISNDGSDRIPKLYASSLNVVDENLQHISTQTINSERNVFARYIFPGMAGCTMVFNNVLKQIIVSGNPTYLRMHDIWIYDVCVAVGGRVVLDEDSYIMYRQHANNTVGIKRESIFSMFDTYVNKCNVSGHHQSLVNCYERQMTQTFKELSMNLANCNISFASRIKLLFGRNMQFGSIGLSILFKMKVLLRKM